jgi:putative membrane protein
MPALLLVVGLVAYLAGWVACRRRRPWPWPRVVMWCAGSLAALAAVVGPLPERSHASFPAHMTGHLLLGMIGPLLLALSAPVTLALRALPVEAARRLVRVLASRPARFVAHPVPALVSNAGGLWLLYTTPLLGLTHHEPVVHGLVHVHVLVSGYLLVSALVGVDPDRHRRGYRCRAAVLLVSFAAHSILAKYLYAHPPPGIPSEQAELGSQLMYYGGDVVEVLIVVLFCRRWYDATRPSEPGGSARSARGSEPVPATEQHV